MKFQKLIFTLNEAILINEKAMGAVRNAYCLNLAYADMQSCSLAFKRIFQTKLVIQRQEFQTIKQKHNKENPK